MDGERPLSTIIDSTLKEDVSMAEANKVKTVPLAHLAEICLGKVILKDDIAPQGNARVAGVSNMTEQGLEYEDMETTQVTEEDASKYEIKDNDVLITCRGTKFRSVLVENKPPGLVIASGNLMIIRCGEAADAAVIHLYLQSPLGQETIIQQFQGKNSINIGKKQLSSLEIPVMSEQTKSKLVRIWKRGRKKYMSTILEAEQEWKSLQVQVYEGLMQKVEFGDQTSETIEQTGLTSTPVTRESRQNKKRDRLLIELD